MTEMTMTESTEAKTLTLNVHKPLDPITLYATNPEQLAVSHKELYGWCIAKLGELDEERVEQEALLAAAQKGRFKVSAVERMLHRTQQRVIFYEKIKLALERGYFVVPNMPIQTLAVRTRLKTPAGQAVSNHWADFIQRGQSLAPGLGEYQDPNPVVQRDIDQEKNSKGELTTIRTSYPTAWRDLEFPIELASPALLETANRALQEKLFDELGFVRDENRSQGNKSDPILVGRIRNPMPRRLDVTFFLGWRINTALI
jgi:hypothetical protein